VEHVTAAHVVVGGNAEGELVKSTSPISFWGGVDPLSGLIIDRRHDRCGDSIVGSIFAFPEEKGSSTASAVLVELVRNGHAPAAIITCKVPTVLALGTIIADELYHSSVPIFSVDQASFDSLVDGSRLRISEKGEIEAVGDQG
jgi:predicted aconitase with swiveling domain